MKVYEKDIDFVTQLILPWEKLNNRTILISGATGMIGSFLIHVLMKRPESIRIIALGRNKETAKKRFREYWGIDNFQFISHDINQPLQNIGISDYVIHAASNTHPISYASDPIGTIKTNVIGTYHLLNYAVQCSVHRFLFMSSVEIYGENRGDIEYFNEKYCGYIDCNTMRAGYPESKRAGEALCQAYRKANELDIVIARAARTYGPTMLYEDTKAISQFIKNGLEKKDIVLKSEGNQLYSYNYVADSVSGLLTILLKGNDGEAYNISDCNSNYTLKQLASLIANLTGVNIKYEIPSVLEQSGYSKATKALMDSTKLEKLGWKAHWNMENGIRQTLEYLNTYDFSNKN